MAAINCDLCVGVPISCLTMVRHPFCIVSFNRFLNVTMYHEFSTRRRPSVIVKLHEDLVTVLVPAAGGA